MSSWLRLSGYLNSKPTGPPLVNTASDIAAYFESAFKRLKGSQRHWYVFEESTLRLLAYRNEMDAAIPDKEPLKIININGAVFHIDPAEHNQFSIMSEGKEHILQAETEDAMLLWLHVLQTRRNEAVQSNDSESSSTNDDNLTDYKLFHRNSFMKIQSSLPSRVSPNTPPDTNDSTVNETINPRKSIIQSTTLPKHDTIIKTQSSVSNSPDQTSSIFHLSWMSLLENTCTTPTTTTTTTTTATTTLNNTASRRTSFNRSRSYDSSIVKQHVNDRCLNDKQFLCMSKSNNHLHNRVEQSPRRIYHRDVMNTPIEEENEDCQTDVKLCKDNGLLNNTNEQNNSLSRETMKELDNLSENKYPLGIQQKEVIPTSDFVSTDEVNQIEKENHNVLKITSVPESQLIRQYSSPAEYFTSQLSAKYQSPVILQNCLTLNDNNMDVENELSQNDYIRELKSQLQSALDREACLRQMLTSREAGLREIDQKVESIGNNESKDNSSIKLPRNISANKLRDMIEDYDQKQRILNRKNQFLITEIRELATIKYMFTDHTNKMSKYIQRLNMEGFKWRREYVKLLQACLGATQTDPHHRLMFSDYGKDRYKMLISELLDEARRKDPSLPSMIKPKTADYHVDFYGFKHSYLNETSIIHYSCQQLYSFYTRQLSGGDENFYRWTELLTQANRELTRADLEVLCRSGVPIQYREGVWRMLIHGELNQLMQIKGPLYYNGLLEEFSENTLATQHRRQISLDLLRTMPNNVQFDNIEAPGVQKLQEVLQAYSIHNAKVGYCQGMNFIAAIALLFLKKEDAFWCLIAILEHFLPEKYFHSGLIDAQVDQLVLKEIVNEKLPLLSNHLKRLGIDISAVTLNWFLAIFYDSVPFETLLRIWDVFLLEGSETLFRFAVAILKRNEDMLLEQTDTISFWKCLKAATRLTYDVDGLVKTAFEELRPFPKPQLIATRRAYHYEILSKKMSIKKGYWQNVMQESADEYGENHNQQNRVCKENQAVIQAITFYDNEHLWICHGDKSYSQISEVVVTTNCMQSIGYELESRVSCICAFNNEIILLGMMSKQLCAYSVRQNSKLWQIPIHDSVTDLTSAYFPHDHTNKVYAGLTNGELVVIENVGVNEPRDFIYYITISFIPISSVLLTRNQLWCASGSSIFIFHAKTMDYYKQISISNNPLDVILKICLGENGVWIAVRGSSIIELWDPEIFTRILLFNIANETYLSRRPEEEYVFNPQRVTVILPYENTIWVGTGMGEVLVYQVMTYQKAESRKSSDGKIHTTKHQRSMSLKDELYFDGEATWKSLTKSSRSPSNPDLTHMCIDDSQLLFYPLHHHQHNSTVLDKDVDSTWGYQLQKIVRSKVAETPVRFLVMKK
ncbi:TBC1 domain family member 2B [Schistosoma japonicum]|nr:TBC1 domain family member 2B [Schistosoma japonicum]